METLVRRYYPSVFKYVLSFVHNEDDSYDVTQDVFLAVIQNISSFVPWRTVKGWIFTIAHNKSMDFFRRAKRDYRDVEYICEMEDMAATFEDVFADTLVVRELLNSLKPTQREVVHLYYFEGYTAPQISKMTGTPLPTVKSRLTTAKRILRELTEEMNNGR